MHAACTVAFQHSPAKTLTSLVHQVALVVDEVAVRIVPDLHCTVHLHRRANGPLLRGLGLLSTSSTTTTPDGLERFVPSGGLCRGACAAVGEAGALHGRSTASVTSLADTHCKHVGKWQLLAEYLKYGSKSHGPVQSR